jgi:hypothetical protein
MSLLLRLVIFLSILGSLMIGFVRWIGQQTSINPEAFKAKYSVDVQDDLQHIYILEDSRGLWIDLTNKPCFKGLLPPKMVADDNQYLWVVRDAQGILVMEAFTLSGCYFLR